MMTIQNKILTLHPQLLEHRVKALFLMYNPNS